MCTAAELMITYVQHLKLLNFEHVTLDTKTTASGVFNEHSKPCCDCFGKMGCLFQKVCHNFGEKNVVSVMRVVVSASSGNVKVSNVCSFLVFISFISSCPA